MSTRRSSFRRGILALGGPLSGFSLALALTFGSVALGDTPGGAGSAGVPALTGAGLTVLGLDPLIDELGLRRLYGRAPAPRPIRVAILDNGFGGYRSVLGTLLPRNLQYHPGSVPAGSGGNPPEDPHGTVMAELVYRLMTGDGQAPQLAPEVHIYNTRGYTNFEEAVDDCIARRMDVILYAQVWEYGGNGDGRGFIDALVARATRAGIAWINASGDFGQTTFQAYVHEAEGDWADLPGPNHSVELRCEPSPQGICPLRLVLSWNDFKDDVNAGTDKDLDLVLTDDTLNIVRTSVLTQKLAHADGPGESLYPREIITAPLRPGTYYVRVKIRSHNFGPRDRLRLTASGDFISMPRHVTGDSLLPPADSPGVISVGSLDSARTGVSRSLGRPDVSVRSAIRLQAGVEAEGTSSAAALVAAMAGLLKSTYFQQFKDNSRARLLSGIRWLLRQGDQTPENPKATPNPFRPTLASLGFAPTGVDACFEPVNPGNPPQPFRQVFEQGGVLVRTTAGFKIAFPFDPIRLFPGTRRRVSSDILALSRKELSIYPRVELHQLPRGSFELFQLPVEQVICSHWDH